MKYTYAQNCTCTHETSGNVSTVEQICGTLLILLRRKTGVFSEMGFVPTSM